MPRSTDDPVGPVGPTATPETVISTIPTAPAAPRPTVAPRGHWLVPRAAAVRGSGLSDTIRHYGLPGPISTSGDGIGRENRRGRRRSFVRSPGWIQWSRTHASNSGPYFRAAPL